MKNTNIISIQKICVIYDIPNSFIESLFDFELIDIIDENNEQFIHEDQIRDIERFIRLHYDLKINFEGLDVILNLLNKISSLESDLNEARNELAFYHQLSL